MKGLHGFGVGAGLQSAMPWSILSILLIVGCDDVSASCPGLEAEELVNKANNSVNEA